MSRFREKVINGISTGCSPKSEGKCDVKDTISFTQPHKQDMQENYLEIYLYYPWMYEKSVMKLDNSQFFLHELNNVDEIVSGQPVFIKQKHALRYSRFMDVNHSILKAYVPDLAIEGIGQELSLRRGYLTKGCIHGCFHSCDMCNNYFANPAFDSRISVAVDC